MCNTGNSSFLLRAVNTVLACKSLQKQAAFWEKKEEPKFSVNLPAGVGYGAAGWAAGTGTYLARILPETAKVIKERTATDRPFIKKLYQLPPERSGEYGRRLAKTIIHQHPILRRLGTIGLLAGGTYGLTRTPKSDNK